MTGDDLVLALLAPLLAAARQRGLAPDADELARQVLGLLGCQAEAGLVHHLAHAGARALVERHLKDNAP